MLQRAHSRRERGFYVARRLSLTLASPPRALMHRRAILKREVLIG